MDIVYGILFTVGKIIFCILTVLAFIVSAMILFKPNSARSFNSKFNEHFSTQKISDDIDTHINTDQIIMKYRWWVGGLFLVGSLFTIKYLLLEFDQAKFISLVLDPAGGGALLFTQVAVGIIKWFMAIVSVVGAVVCLIIMVHPETFQKINRKMDAAFSTKNVQDTINASHTSLDGWVLENHIAVGLFLFLGSIFMSVFILTTLL